MDARIDVRKAVDQVPHAIEGRRACDVVEVDAGHRPAAEDGDGQVNPVEVLAPLAGVGGGDVGCESNAATAKREPGATTRAEAGSGGVWTPAGQGGRTVAG